MLSELVKREVNSLRLQRARKYSELKLTPLFRAIAFHRQLGVSHVFVGVYAAGDLLESGQRILGTIRQVRV